MTRIARRAASFLDGWMAGAYPVSAEGLGLFRIAYAAFMLAVLFPSYRWLAEYPEAFWVPPPGPFRLMFGFPPRPVLVGMEWTLALALVALLIGYRTRLASYVVGALIVVGDGLVYSSYRVDHHITVPLVAIALGYAGWGSAWSVDSLRRRTAPVRLWPITFLLACIGVMMTTSGAAKLIGGWLDPRTHAVLGYTLQRSEVLDTPFREVLLAMPGWSVEMLDQFTVVVELSFVFALLAPSVGRVVVSLATLLHLGILLVVTIPFLSILVGYAVLLPWTQLARGLRSVRRLPSPRALGRYAALVVVAAGVGVAALRSWTGPPLDALLRASTGNTYATGYAVHTLAALVGIAYIAWVTRAAMASRRRRS